MRRERMPQGVRGHPPSRQQTLAILFHHRTYVAFGEALLSPIEEEGPTVLPRHERAAAVQVIKERRDRVVRERDLTLFGPLAEHDHATSIEIEPAQAETC